MSEHDAAASEHRFVLRRVEFEEQGLRSFQGDRIKTKLGGQLEWFWGVPGVFRALASPLTGESIPAAPTRREPHAQILGYWGALHYLLLVRLGWTRPDKGLRWWYESGKPVADPTLALVAAVWDADGGVDPYLTWLLEGRPEFLMMEDREFGWQLDPEPLNTAWTEWRDRMRVKESFEFACFRSGWDELHLSGHSGEGGQPDPNSHITVTSSAKRRAVFVTDTMDAWYFDLADKARSLPNIGVQSWRVDVFVRPVGFLGTYRRSRDTGRWFAGRHRYHTPGN